MYTRICIHTRVALLIPYILIFNNTLHIYIHSINIIYVKILNTLMLFTHL